MTSAREELERLVKELERQRDELRLKASLGKMEAREEWEKLEKKLESLKAKAPQVREELDATAGGIGAALKKAGEEIRAGYERLRKLL